MNNGDRRGMDKLKPLPRSVWSPAGTSHAGSSLATSPISMKIPASKTPRAEGTDRLKGVSKDQLEYFFDATGAYPKPASEAKDGNQQQPDNFCRGLGLVEKGKSRVTPEQPAAPPPEKPPLCGAMPYHAGNVRQEMKQYVVVHKDRINMHLLRYFVDRVWALPRPDVIISVTGGAANFKLATDHKDKIMQGMFDGTRSLTPWFITGGTDAGIMRHVGEARAKYRPEMPLIAVCSLGSVAGLKQLKTMRDEAVEEPLESGQKRWKYTPASTKGSESQNSQSATQNMHEDKDEWVWSSDDVGASREWRLIKSGGEKRNDVLSYEDLIGMEMSPGKSLKRDDLNQKIDNLKDQIDTLKDDKLEEEDRVHADFEATKERLTQELKELEEDLRVKIELNHSHFIIVEDDSTRAFGAETEIRAEFEACAGHNRSKFEFKIGDELPKPERMSEVRIQQEIGKYVKRERYTWPEPYSEPTSWSALGEKCRKKIALTS